MFGIRIGGSGKLYLATPAGTWKPFWFAGGLDYILDGRMVDEETLLHDPTLPHPATGRPIDPTLCRDELAAWRELQELRALVRDTILGADPVWR